MKEYRHDPTETVVTDYGNGHVIIDLRYSPDEQVFLSQAAWFVETLGIIVREAGKPLDLIFDLYHFDPSVWDATMRHTCRQMVEESTIVRKIALVGDGLTYTTVLVTLSELQKNREKIKFFFHREEALDWLEW